MDIEVDHTRTSLEASTPTDLLVHVRESKRKIEDICAWDMRPVLFLNLAKGKAYRCRAARQAGLYL
jgi:hypothetical protein